jgi:dTDP-4-dehydrorhamnose reductase
MLATDFAKLFSETYELIYTDYKELDITDIFAIEKKVEEIKPEIIINLAAYTAVDDAEDI